MKRAATVVLALLLLIFAAHPCSQPDQTARPPSVVAETKALAPREEDSRAVESILIHNPKLGKKEAERLWRTVMRTVERFKADPVYSVGAAREITAELVLSVILVESNARRTAHSKAGAVGLMQIVPVHHIKSLNSAGILRDKSELWNAERNIMAGTYILMCYAMSSESVKEALARYNAGRRIAAGMPYARKVLSVHDRVIGQSNKRSVVYDTGKKSS